MRRTAANKRRGTRVRARLSNLEEIDTRVCTSVMSSVTDFFLFFFSRRTCGEHTVHGYRHEKVHCAVLNTERIFFWPDAAALTARQCARFHSFGADAHLHSAADVQHVHPHDLHHTRPSAIAPLHIPRPGPPSHDSCT